ncbi:MAG: hypothetical protein C0516_05230 [Gemmatimonas sp.]|nr:hypothetical protein [Gemmatimonas sp.]
MPYGALISILFMFAALMVGRKLITLPPEQTANRPRFMARVLLSLGLLVGASLPGAGGATWQAWTCGALIAGAMLAWLVGAFVKRSSP